MARRLPFVRALGYPKRFELSAVNDSAITCVVCWLPLVLLFARTLGFALVLASFALLPAAFLLRRVLVVTVDGAFFEQRVFGVVVRRQSLGIAPTVGNFGWDWDELGIMPRDPALRRGLEDDERVVLVESTDAASSERLATLVRAEIDRLHAHHLSPNDYRTNARAY
jgi:hypothetical protein